MTDFNDLRAKAQEREASNPQRAYLAVRALSHAEEAIGELAKLGYRYHLTEGDAPAAQEWPKMLYHDKLAPEGQVFENLDATKDLEAGWHDRPTGGVQIVSEKMRAEEAAKSKGNSDAKPVPGGTQPNGGSGSQSGDQKADGNPKASS